MSKVYEIALAAVAESGSRDALCLLRKRLHFLRNARFQYMSNPVMVRSGTDNPAAAQTTLTPNPQ